jgi:transcription initiation factor TFIIIB Brf1 subunit/transcription initiation factor TFIIB
MLRKWDKRIQVNSNHHDKARGEMVAKYCEKLELGIALKSDIHKYMLKSAKDKLIQGRNTVEMLAAVIHYVCKKHGVPKSLAEISRHTNVPTKKIYKNYSVICQEYGTVQKVQDIETYVTQYIVKAKMPIKYEPELRRLLALLKKEKFQEGKSPNVIIATLIRFIAINVNDYPTTLEKIAHSCDISDVAVRGMLKLLPPSMVLMY